MNAPKIFALMSDADLVAAYAQYGRAAQAPFYREYPRRALVAELLRRKIPLVVGTTSARPKGYGPTGDSYAPNWGLSSIQL